MSLQTAKGMEFIAEQSLQHRDLGLEIAIFPSSIIFLGQVIVKPKTFRPKSLYEKTTV